MPTTLKPGSRFRSATGDVEVIVIKAAAAETDLRCGGYPMLAASDPMPDAVAAEPGFDGGTQIGKRYADESGDLELLCTKAGEAALSVGDTLLQPRDAKPLPSSD